MTHSSRNVMLIAVFLFLTGVVPVLAQLSPEETGRISDAAPVKPTVMPRQPRTLLVFSRSEGYRHSAILRARAALEIMGKKTGAFQTVYSEDLSVFRPESLRRFDAVCLNNTTQLKFDDPELRKSLLEFVSSGKGIVGIHAATDNFPTWPEGQELLGGGFDAHPWTADGTWAVRIEDPNHPLNAAFQGKDFLLKDEIYRIRQINLRKNARVLLGLDMKAERNRKVQGVRASDRDIPISWVKPYGKGRVFYCSLGHNDEVYTQPAVLQHYLDGIQYALGDFPVDTTPLPFDPMSFFQQDSLTVRLRRVSTYQYGNSRAALVELAEFIRGVHDLPEARRILETQFLEFLKGDASSAGKQFVAQQLALIGSDASTLPLVGMLADTAMADMALYALESLPGVQASAALQGALAHAKGRTLVGVINVLAHRRVEEAAGALSALIDHPDTTVAETAISALGKIGAVSSLDVLGRAKEQASGARRKNICEALLNFADQLRTKGDNDRALAVFRMLNSPLDPIPVRRASLRGMILADPVNAPALIKATLQSGDATLHPIAAQYIGELRAIDHVRTIAATSPHLPAVTQVQVLAALAPFRDVEVQKVVVSASTSKDFRVRIAALRALGSMGDASAVPLLARASASSQGAEQKEARSSLYALHAPGVNDSLVALLPRVDKKVKVELIKGIDERMIPSAVPLLLTLARDPARDVRSESAKALKSLADRTHLPAMVDLLLRPRDKADRQTLELAVVGVARRIPDPSKQDEAVLMVYPSIADVSTRASLINVLGKIGAPGSSTVLKEALEDKNAEIRLAAIRALSDWPTADPCADLWQCATGAKEPSHRILALRGFVRLIGRDTTRSIDQTMRMYQNAMSIAPNIAEKRLMLSAIGEVRSVAALRLVAGYLNDKTLCQEAEAATLSIAAGITGPGERETIPYLRQLVGSSTDSASVARAEALLAKIERKEP